MDGKNEAAMEGLPGMEGSAGPQEDPTTLAELMDMGRKLLDIKRRKEELQAAMALLAEEEGHISGSMVKIMTSVGPQNFKLDDIRFQIDNQMEVNILAANRDVAKEWLKNHPAGKDIVRVKEDFSTSSLKALIKEMESQNQPVPDWAKVAHFTRIKMVPVKKGAKEGV